MNKTDTDDAMSIAEICDALQRDLSAAQARIKELEEALRLPFDWTDAFHGDNGGKRSDELLNRHGWDGKCSPEEFMERYARAALKK